MSLRDSVLGGIRSWYRATEKDLLRARRHTLTAFGEWFQTLGCPATLYEARDVLERITCRMAVYEDDSVELPGSKNLQRRVRDLVQAIDSVESREGVEPIALAEQLLDGKGTVEDSVRLIESFGIPSQRQVRHASLFGT